MKKKPNLIFILVDDLGWRDLSCYGSSFHESPHIDRLVGSGLRFSDAYAACPVCSPTRASLLAGKYPATLGVTDYIHWDRKGFKKRGRVVDAPYVDHLPHEQENLAKVLGRAGYQTWHVGKWHLGDPGSYPEDHGFEVNVGGCEFGHPGKNGYFSPWTLPVLQDADVPEGTYLTDYLTDRAIGLLQGRDTRRPFYLNLWYYSVHTPIQAKEATVRKYEEKARQMGLDEGEAIVEVEPYPTEDKRGQRVRRRLFQSNPTYAAMIEHLDENIGRLMQALEESGEADNTLIVFTSDNGGLSTGGPVTSNRPLAEGKGWMQDGGIRVPLAICWPGVTRAGAESSEPVTSPDLYPTILDAVGVERPTGQSVDGASLEPLLRGGESLEREAILWHYPHYGDQGGTPGSSVRMGDWKLIERHEDGSLEFYHLGNDIGEERNLAVDEPERVEAMHERLRAWQKSIEARFPEANADWVDVITDRANGR